MYRINEGLIDIPDDWQDRSVNVIGSTITGAGVTMTITRDEIPMGMPFAEYVQGQADRPGMRWTVLCLPGRAIC